MFSLKYATIGFALFVLNIGDVTGQYLSCISEGCEYTEGDVAVLHAEIEPIPGATVIQTIRGVPEGFGPINGNIDYAQPALDYTPIVVESDYSISIEIELVDDCDVENDEVFTVDLDEYIVKAPAKRRRRNGPEPISEVIVIKDNDDNFWIEKDQYTVSETTSPFQFNVMRDARGVLAATTLEYSTRDMTAKSPVDFVSVTSGEIFFAEDSNKATGTVEIVSDLNSTEDTEVFGVSIVYNDPRERGWCTGKVVNPSEAFITILDSDTTLYQIEQSAYSVTETKTGTTEFTFKILRKGNTAPASTLVFDTRAVSALSGKDFESHSNSAVQFGAYSTSKEVSVTIFSDEIREDTEIFEVSIRSPTMGEVVFPSKATVTIQDVAVTRSCVRFDSSVYVALESAMEVSLTLQRDGNLAIEGYIAIITQNIDATSPEDYTAKTGRDVVKFGVNEKEKSVTIELKDDSLKESVENFRVMLQPPTQPQYTSNALDICTKETQVQIKDDDDEVKFEGSSFRVHEEDKFFMLNIIRCGYLGKTSEVRLIDVTGNYPDSATRGPDYTLATTTIVEFGVNERSQEVEIEITSETPPEYEGEEELVLMLEPVSTDEQDKIGYPNKASVFITDNFACSQDCLHGGTCVDTNTCSCLPTFTGDRCQTPRRVFEADFTITNQEFTQELNDPNSQRYRSLKALIEGVLDLQFRRSIEGYQSVTVIGFSSGSVIVQYRVAANTDSNTNLNEVSETFEQGVNNDYSLGDTGLMLQPTDIDCPTDQCLNGGTCIGTGTSYYCQCPEGFYGSQCLLSYDVNGDQDDEADVAPSKDTLSGAAIAGIILGVLAAILLIGLLGICFCLALRHVNNKPPFPTQNPPLQQIELQPYEGVNPVYRIDNGVMGVQPLY